MHRQPSLNAIALHFMIRHYSPRSHCLLTEIYLAAYSEPQSCQHGPVAIRSESVSRKQRLDIFTKFYFNLSRLSLRICKCPSLSNILYIVAALVVVCSCPCRLSIVCTNICSVIDFQVLSQGSQHNLYWAYILAGRTFAKAMHEPFIECKSH